MKKKIIKAKILRWLGFTKLIELSEQERKWIKLLKGHYKDTYRTDASNWIDTLKPMFEKDYGWSAEEHYHDFLNCMFNKLLDIHLKIKLDRSGGNQQLKDIMRASFYESIRRDYKLPIERSIAELCGLIQNTLVIKDGVHRFTL